MAVVLESFRIQNKTRGGATMMATFDVNLGALSVKGMELVRLQNGDVFISPPRNRYQKNGEWRQFNYIAFNGERGNALKADVTRMAQEEYDRRGGKATPSSGGGYGQGGGGYKRGGGTGGGYKGGGGYTPKSQDNTGDYDDGLPY